MGGPCYQSSSHHSANVPFRLNRHATNSVFQPIVYRPHSTLMGSIPIRFMRSKNACSSVMLPLLSRLPRPLKSSKRVNRRRGPLQPCGKVRQSHGGSGCGLEDAAAHASGGCARHHSTVLGSTSHPRDCWSGTDKLTEQDAMSSKRTNATDKTTEPTRVPSVSISAIV